MAANKTVPRRFFSASLGMWRGSAADWGNGIAGVEGRLLFGGIVAATRRGGGNANANEDRMKEGYAKGCCK